MLKMYAKGEKDGRPHTVVALGLSHTNLAALKARRPILFTGDAVGLTESVSFVIFSGESEDAMAKEFASLVGPDTVVDDRRQSDGQRKRDT